MEYGTQDGADQRRGDSKVSKHGNTWILDVGVVCPGTKRYVDQASSSKASSSSSSSQASSRRFRMLYVCSHVVAAVTVYASAERHTALSNVAPCTYHTKWYVPLHVYHYSTTLGTYVPLVRYHWYTTYVRTYYVYKYNIISKTT